MIPAGFHFLRPEWLFALVPAALLAAMVWRQLGAGGKAWARIVDAHLLRFLALTDTRRARRWPVAALLAAWTLATLAMAGPSWERLPSPVLDRRDPTVVVLSLAQSMNATDQSPTRLGAARHKVEDILKRMRGEQVGLIIFADRPFVASPLTEDGRVIGQMLPELATDLMPVVENRPDLAITRAIELLKSAGAPTGRIILLTDGPGDAPEETAQAAAQAARDSYQLSVIGLGTRDGSTLLAFDGAPARAPDGTTLVTRMDADGLAGLASAGGGSFTPATADGSDLERVFSAMLARPGGILENTGLSADQWADMGPWLLIGVLLLAPLAFRRGWIAVLLLAALPSLAPLGRPAAAQDLTSSRQWRDLWQTPDQQGASALARGDFEAASRSFDDPAWRASALYKAGDYEAAAEAFAHVPGGDYNRGNALAHAGKLEEALKAYDAALGAEPGHQDAAYNRNIVQILLKKQKDDEQKKKDQDKKDQQQGDHGSDKQPSGGQSSKNQPDKGQDGKGQPDKPDGKEQNDKAGNGADQKPPARPQGPDKAAQQPPPTPPKPAESPPPAPLPKPEAAKSDPPKPPPPAPSGAQAPRDPKPAAPATAERDQNKEQMLRMVPDDPAGLLRARIRSHYDASAPSGPGDQ